MIKEEIIQKKEVPVGVKIISILYFLLAAGCLIIIISAPFVVLKGVSPENTSEVFSQIIISLLILILLIIIVIFSFFVARGLWKRKDWARKASIIFSIILLLFYLLLTILLLVYIPKILANLDGVGNLSGIVSIFRVKFSFSDSLFIAVNLAIIVYLGFSKKVKEAFKNN